MKKILCFLLSALLLVTAVAAFGGCGSESKCKVTFVMGEGLQNIVIEVNKGDGIAKEDIPKPVQKEGYTAKWEITDFSRITGDIVVKAVYTPMGEAEPVFYTVTFVFENESNQIRTVKEGEALSEADIPAPPAKEGFTVKWDREDFSRITENIEVKAVYTPIAKKTVKVNFEMKRGNTSVWANWVDSAEFDIGKEYSLPDLKPAKGYESRFEFNGWKYNGTDVALKGVFNESFAGKEVTFVLNYGEYTKNY